MAGGKQADARFAELMENVGTVLAHFNERVEAARATGGWDWSVARVLDVIKGGPSLVSCPVLEHCWHVRRCWHLRSKRHGSHNDKQTP